MACLVKALYGRTAAKVWFDDALKRPVLSIVEQPRNLRLGWTSSDHTKLSWAVYTYLISADAAEEEYGLRIEQGRSQDLRDQLPSFEGQPDKYYARNEADGSIYPYVAGVGSHETTRAFFPGEAELQLEVYDYWYRKPVEGATFELGKGIQMETWNALFVGNALIVRKKHTEYEGRLPYVPLTNTFIPGTTIGRPAWKFLEQHIRE